MRFWDSSAVVPLITPEKSSRWCHSLLKEDSRMVVWCFTSTEALSALLRQERAGRLSRSELHASKNQLRALQETWTEIIHLEAVRNRADRLLESHPLHAADALQLAAVLVAFNERPQGAKFVCLDNQLAIAAEKEGFAVLMVTTATQQ